METEIIVVVQLFIRPEREVAFRKFESQTARIMRRYGGQIDKVLRPISSTGNGPLPYEIHVLSFPSLERLEAYRDDRDLADLAPLRQTAISRTEVMIGEEGQPYP